MKSFVDEVSLFIDEESWETGTTELEVLVIIESRPPAQKQYIYMYLK